MKLKLDIFSLLFLINLNFSYVASSLTLKQATTFSSSPNSVIYENSSNSFIVPVRDEQKVFLFEAITGTFSSIRDLPDLGAFRLFNKKNTDFFLVSMNTGKVAKLSGTNLGFSQTFQTSPSGETIYAISEFQYNSIYLFGDRDDKIWKYDIIGDSVLSSVTLSAANPSIYYMENINSGLYQIVTYSYSNDHPCYRVFDATNMTNLKSCEDTKTEAVLSPSFSVFAYFTQDFYRKLKKFKVSDNSLLTETAVGTSLTEEFPKSIAEIAGLKQLLVFDDSVGSFRIYSGDTPTFQLLFTIPEGVVTHQHSFLNIHPTKPYIALASFDTSRSVGIYSMTELCHPKCGSLCTLRYTLSLMNCDDCVIGYYLQPDKSCANSCPYGQYFDSSMICQPCPPCCPNCYLQSSIIICPSATTPGFYFQNESCHSCPCCSTCEIQDNNFICRGPTCGDCTTLQIFDSGTDQCSCKYKIPLNDYQKKDSSIDDLLCFPCCFLRNISYCV